jgi:hypothetical protein
VEPSPHVFAWAEEFFAHYAPGEDAQEQEKEETR